MKTRLMNEEDIKKVEELETEAFSLPWSGEKIKKTFLRDDSIYCVVEEGDAVVGYAAFFYVLDEGNIINVVVDKVYREKGYGRELMRYLLSKAKERKLKSLALEVRESNERAIRFYEKVGFEKVGVRKDFYERPRENGIVMISTIC